MLTLTLYRFIPISNILFKMERSWYENLGILDIPGNQIAKIAKFTTATGFIIAFVFVWVH